MGYLNIEEDYEYDKGDGFIVKCCVEATVYDGNDSEAYGDTYISTGAYREIIDCKISNVVLQYTENDKERKINFVPKRLEQNVDRFLMEHGG